MCRRLRPHYRLQMKLTRRRAVGMPARPHRIRIPTLASEAIALDRITKRVVLRHRIIRCLRPLLAQCGQGLVVEQDGRRERFVRSCEELNGCTGGRRRKDSPISIGLWMFHRLGGERRSRQGTQQGSNEQTGEPHTLLRVRQYSERNGLRERSSASLRGGKQRSNLEPRQEHFFENVPFYHARFATLEIERHKTPANIAGVLHLRITFRRSDSVALFGRCKSSIWNNLAVSPLDHRTYPVGSAVTSHVICNLPETSGPGRGEGVAG
jgi:hypothetical protein